MFRRLFCCMGDPPSPRPEDGPDDGDSSPCPPQSGHKERAESVGRRFSLKRLAKHLWDKVTAPSKPKIKRNQVAPEPFVESEQKPRLKAGAKCHVTKALTSAQKPAPVETKETLGPSCIGAQKPAPVETKETLGPSCIGAQKPAPVETKETLGPSCIGLQKPKPVETKMTLDPSHFGLPNFGNSCYLNASVQSIMNIAPFMDRVNAQENIWTHHKNAELLRHLQCIADLKKPHVSKDYFHQVRCLQSFKHAIASKVPEFHDGQQKDAHEFLTALIEQIQSLAPPLRMSASSLGMTYHCPVQDLMRFSMNWTRTCHRCGLGSSRQDVNTSISLNLHSHSTIDLLLQDYLKEADLAFRCDCGGQASSLKSLFSSLPKVLILHLNRFRFTPDYRLEKATDDVHLNRDLVVSSSGDAGCFSLMGVISHIGPSANCGHYIYDGRSPADCPYEPADRWLNFNDSRVQETTGRAVCKNRQSTAYILFYQRVMEE